MLFSALAAAVLYLPRSSLPPGANYELSSLLVQTFPDPESPQDAMRVVVGCLYDYNDRSPGQNASLAAERRIELRREYGIFFDPSTPHEDRRSILETLDDAPSRRATEELIRAEIRREYGCEYSRAFGYGIAE